MTGHERKWKSEMASVSQWPPRSDLRVIDAVRGGGLGTVVPACGWGSLVDYRPAIIGVWARQRGGARAAFDDVGIVRGETTRKAKAWVVRGGIGSPAAVALDCRARDTGHGPVGP